MSSNTLPFRAPARAASRVVMRTPRQELVQEAAVPSETPSRRSALHRVADAASPAVHGDFRVFALGNR